MTTTTPNGNATLPAASPWRALPGHRGGRRARRRTAVSLDRHPGPSRFRRRCTPRCTTSPRPTPLRRPARLGGHRLRLAQRRQPHLHNMKWPGVLDTFRVPKPGAAFYRSQVNPTVTPGHPARLLLGLRVQLAAERPGAGAMIATNCDRLEIYVGRPAFRHRNARRCRLRQPVTSPSDRRSDGRRNRPRRSCASTDIWDCS